MRRSAFGLASPIETSPWKQVHSLATSHSQGEGNGSLPTNDSLCKIPRVHCEAARNMLTQYLQCAYALDGDSSFSRLVVVDAALLLAPAVMAAYPALCTEVVRSG